MRSLDYLELLSQRFPNRKACLAEIINLSAIMELPKGTEYFFSDVHGEYEAFSYLVRSASGSIRGKIEILFGDTLTPSKRLDLVNLICYPREILANLEQNSRDMDAYLRESIERLIIIAGFVSSKYTRSKVRKKMPQGYGYALDELIHTNGSDLNKNRYHKAILDAIFESGAAKEYTLALCELIQSLIVDHLHIVGDIFDRGARPDKIMDELMAFHDVDIQWGNHDMTWIGASRGNLACICNVLHVATLYNCFDVLEDGYGINLRPLSMLAEKLYPDDPCLRFQPHLLDENVADELQPELAAKMCKVMTILMFKLEGRLIQRHPEYGLDNRLLLDGIDLPNGTITFGGKTYALLDTNLPTMRQDDPRALTAEEEKLLATLRYSFMHSEKLQAHVRYLLQKGAMYQTFNGNLLFHGCIPMNEDGSFLLVQTEEGPKSGKALLDYYDHKVRWLFTLADNDPRLEKESDICWYLWCGPRSPLFGKDQITTFERLFIDDKSLYREVPNAYFRFAESEATVRRVLEEFGLDPERGHIINGHVPVLVKKGESPIKANGRLFRIDGGLSKAYHAKTGIAGYTLIYNSHHLALAEHSKFQKYGENTPSIHIVESFKQRALVKDTDIGKHLASEVADLKQLIAAFSQGEIKEKS